jgi:hypothetical protein
VTPTLTYRQATPADAPRLAAAIVEYRCALG